MDKVVQSLRNEIKKAHGLDFVHANTHKLTNGDHPYPASMIPQLPDLFLKALRNVKKPKLLLDPFAGSGTTLVEAKAQNIRAIGLDLNPLATLISMVKSTHYNQKKLEQLSHSIKLQVKQSIHSHLKVELPHFRNILFWFKPQVATKLEIIRQAIKKETSNTKFYNFFLVAFSFTIRKVSNSRNGEFKLYRMPKSKLIKWNPKVFHIFFKKLAQNIRANKTLAHKPVQEQSLWCDSKKTMFKTNSFDAVITSPPYGDSKTTVAYGQFSRLELQWIGSFTLNHSMIMPPSFATTVDKHLLGGKVRVKSLKKTPSQSLNKVLKDISNNKPKRALQVNQFYLDLYQSLLELKRIIKPHAYLFFVTGNRTVDGYTLHTNTILTELFKTFHIKLLGRFTRNISSKRMPSRNSPSNHKHHTSETIKHEDILIYRNQ